MKQFLSSIKNNTDLVLDQAHPGNLWIRKNKDGQVHKFESPHTVLGTLPGSVAIHVNGEMDMRGVYCFMVVADILNIVD